MVGGADFIKTSTGKVSPSATLPVALVMLEAVRDFAELTGARVGVKVAGGIRNAKDAIRYLVIVKRDGRRRRGSTLHCSASAPPASSTTC